MGSPPPRLNNTKKNALFSRDGSPNDGSKKIDTIPQREECRKFVSKQSCVFLHVCAHIPTALADKEYPEPCLVS